MQTIKKMKEDISIETWNTQIVILTQAMLGAISPNFRMITIEYKESGFVLKFFLEFENSEDSEEIDDIGFEFESHQNNGEFRYKQETIVTKGMIDWPKFPIRVIYKRRE